MSGINPFAASPSSVPLSSARADKTADEPSSEPPTLRRNSVGTWVVITVLSLLLVATGVFAYLGWFLDDASVPTSGYIAMGFGVIFSLLVGIGLMALLFYSSRKGYDEPAVLIQEPALHRDEVQTTSQENGT